MTEFIIRRSIQALFVLLVMTVLVFFGVNVIGNPVYIFASSECDQACLARIIADLGLDKPVWQQYLIFMGNLFQGELGNSFTHGIPALELIFQRLPATLELAFSALVIALVVGVPLGMRAGLKPEAFSSRMIMGFSMLSFSVPVFWIGLIMIVVFSVQLGWMPAIGRGDTVPFLGTDVSFFTLDGLHHLAMPAFTLSLIMMAMVIRLTRAGMREVLYADYIKFARANGIRERRILSLHVMKNILIPIVTVLGMEFGGVIAFAVVVESIFSWPGVGKMLIDAIAVLDRPLIVAYLIFVVIMFVALNLFVDILYSLLDPRVRLGGAAA
ncbi:ABC transporter permease subunit [Roseobacter sp. HKCCD9010]|jgi:peptide/nickel transport system permease protein|uniref:ABC transporter permease n=1 Tax=Rhodobacterales TaxID=204455 RepID=UPI00119C5786|nr:MULTISPECIES: ABC transporter permease [Rhodobacterales]MBF9050725.1 ABC transporter permease subunit [Rhodobacterales bacterium HKCCD4356]NNV11857.1 ABC transporter permease subunit [Roseobacter sp. HKCCD7357]NNV18008.1 ABC transporter permease subunit [Roseobacter sp. HKCCD8768]NNV26099.1 ABC transporter permease subunit [Roseobacter sp. HKCCD8192]NNV31735.1 ABC transporter permease subunit [Roseobacter sp. HKCCD9061]